MKFEFNKAEKFFYRYRTPLALFMLGCLATTIVLAIIFNERMDFVLSFFAPIFILEIVYIIFNSSLTAKLKKLVELSDQYMDMNAFLGGTNYLLEIVGKKDILNTSSLCISRIGALINLGDYDRAEYELECFKQAFNQKKLDDFVNLVAYIYSAEVALHKNDLEKYKEQALIAQTLLNSYAGPKFNLLKMQNVYNRFTLLTGAFFSDESSDEQRYVADCLASLQISPINGKPRKDKPAPIEYVGAYYKLFLFFKNRSNKEKATTYARLIVNMANPQLADYREAKEFLDNENSSN